MWPSAQDWVSALVIMVPTYCTNGAPVLFGGGKAVDLGRSLWDGERIFGDHKTIRGFAAGLIVGIIVGVTESLVLGQSAFVVAVLTSLGALLGDLAGAFLKRRLRIKPGGSLPGVDQLDFVIGAVLAVSAFFSLTLETVLILLLVTPPLHFLTNVGAYFLGLKQNYW
jgi:CDP-2,3-bis-(O-geranylgeranyl)-sn-glycerol synthase